MALAPRFNLTPADRETLNWSMWVLIVMGVLVLFGEGVRMVWRAIPPDVRVTIAGLWSVTWPLLIVALAALIALYVVVRVAGAAWRHGTRRSLAVLLLALPFVGGCKLMSTAPDPCPMPPEQHPESWTATPLLDASGAVVMYAYACGRQSN